MGDASNAQVEERGGDEALAACFGAGLSGVRNRCTDRLSGGRGPVLRLHLDCEDGAETDIRVTSDGSYAGLLQDSTSVGVLKGIDLNRDGVPEFLVPGFQIGDLTICAAFSGGLFVFIAYVLYTPQGG